MIILGTKIEYDTLQRTERPGAFWLLNKEKRIVRVVKAPNDYFFAMYVLKTHELFFATWDTKARAFRIAQNGVILPEDGDMYDSINRLISRIKKFATGKRKEYHFNPTPEFLEALTIQSAKEGGHSV